MVRADVCLSNPSLMLVCVHTALCKPVSLINKPFKARVLMGTEACGPTRRNQKYHSWRTKAHRLVSPQHRNAE